MGEWKNCSKIKYQQMQIKLTKKDFFWGYFAQFFSLASGLIVLPSILRLLTPEEVGMNYLMLTISSMVALFDFGFAPQFGRNITYVLSGAQKLKKDGIDESSIDNREINYHLLANMIGTAKYVYKRLAFLVLFFMLTVGSIYIYKVTNGFINIDNSFIIWILFSLSTFFNIYYTYYSSLLIGSGKIKDAEKANVFSKLTYIILVLLFLELRLGLIGVVLSNLISPFVYRILSYRWFYTKELKSKINSIVINEEEKKNLFLNNHCLGMIRQFQDSYFQSNYAATVWGYSVPDLVKISEAYGIKAARVENEEDIDSKINLMWANPDEPFLLEVTIDVYTNVFPKMLFGKPLTELEGEN